MDKQLNINELIEFTAEIIAAYAGNNKLEQNELPKLIQDGYKTLSKLNDVTVAQARPKPAIFIKKSIKP